MFAREKERKMAGKTCHLNTTGCKLALFLEMPQNPQTS